MSGTTPPPCGLTPTPGIPMVAQAQAVLHRELLHVHASLAHINTILQQPLALRSPPLLDRVTHPHLRAQLQGLDHTLLLALRVNHTALHYTHELLTAMGLLHILHHSPEQLVNFRVVRISQIICLFFLLLPLLPQFMASPSSRADPIIPFLPVIPLLRLRLRLPEPTIPPFELLLQDPLLTVMYHKHLHCVCSFSVAVSTSVDPVLVYTSHTTLSSCSGKLVAHSPLDSVRCDVHLISQPQVLSHLFQLLCPGATFLLFFEIVHFFTRPDPLPFLMASSASSRDSHRGHRRRRDLAPPPDHMMMLTTAPVKKQTPPHCLQPTLPQGLRLPAALQCRIHPNRHPPNRLPPLATPPLLPHIPSHQSTSPFPDQI